MGYILKEDVVRRCKAVKAIAEKQIKEWRAHTPEYKEKVNCQEAFDREREMRDMLMFLENLPEKEEAYWIIEPGINPTCSFCKSEVPAILFDGKWPHNYCPNCGAEMIAKEIPAVEEHPTVDWCRKCIHRYGSTACIDCYDVYKYFSDGTPRIELNPSNYIPKEFST